MKKLITKLMAVIALILMSAWSLNAQTTTTWILTSDETVDVSTGTGFTAANQVASGFTGGAIVYNKTVGTTTSQAVKTATNSDGSSLPYNSYDATVYLEYTVTPAANYKLTISNVSMLIAGVSDGTICAKIDYSTDDFVSSVNLSEKTNLSSSSMTSVSADLTSIEVSEGSSFKVRVYPKINTVGRTGKYMMSNNVQITFTATELSGTPAPAITAFSAAGIDATIDESAKTISAELPYGTDLSAVTPVVTVNSYASGYTPSGAQDFSGGAVTYTATGTPNVDYAVTLSVGAASSDKDITDLTIGGLTPMYNADTKTFSVVLPKASSLSQIIDFTIPATAGANFTAGAVADLSSTLDITVTAQDLSTQIYHVAATVGTKNIAYVTLASGNDDPYLHGSLLAKGYYVEDVIAVDQAVSFYDNFDLAILFDVVNSSNAAALNIAGLIGTKRFLNLKAYMYGKTGWPTGGGANFTNPDARQVATVETNYVSHPIFTGLTFSGADVTLVDAGGTQRALQGVNTPGSGTVIANVVNSTSANIIEDNTNESAMYMFIGFANGGPTYGLANISADGKKLLDNAVEYLLGDTKYVPTPTDVQNPESNGFLFDGNTIQNRNNELINVFDVTGRLVVSSIQDINMSTRSTGIYLIQSVNRVQKIAIVR